MTVGKDPSAAKLKRMKAAPTELTMLDVLEQRRALEARVFELEGKLLHTSTALSTERAQKKEIGERLLAAESRLDKADKENKRLHEGWHEANRALRDAESRLGERSNLLEEAAYILNDALAHSSPLIDVAAAALLVVEIERHIPPRARTASGTALLQACGPTIMETGELWWADLGVRYTESAENPNPACFTLVRVVEIPVQKCGSEHMGLKCELPAGHDGKHKSPVFE